MKLRLLGWAPLFGASACALVACGKNKSGDAKADAGPTASAVTVAVTASAAPTSTARPVTAEQLDKRCEQLGKACGDKDKHKDKIVEECKSAAKALLDKGCAQAALAAYDCYETEICGKINRVWSLEDFRVLTDRHAKCVAERDASARCLDAMK